MPDRNASEDHANQKMEGVVARGNVNQTSDNAQTKQDMKSVSGADVNQTINGKQDGLTIGKNSANGKWAVIGLVVVAVAFLLFQLLGGGGTTQ